MKFNYSDLDNFNCDAVEIYDNNRFMTVDIAKLLNAVSMNDDNNLWVDIINRNGKLYACIDFDKEYVPGYEGINAWFSLSGNSPLNYLVIRMVSKKVLQYLSDKCNYNPDYRLNTIDNILYESIGALSKKKIMYEKMGGKAPDLSSLMGFNNLSNIMLEYNELTDCNSESTFALNLITALSNYFIANGFENLNDVKSIDEYDKICNGLYKNLLLDKYSRRKYLSRYLTCSSEGARFLTSSIAKCLLSTDSFYNQLSSINNVRVQYSDDGEVVRIMFNNYDDEHVIEVCQHFELSDEGKEVFDYYDLDLKSCNMNFSKNTDEGIVSLIYNLPSLDSVLDEHRELDEGLLFI